MPQDQMAAFYELMAAKKAAGQDVGPAELDEAIRAHMGQADSDQFIGFEALFEGLRPLLGAPIQGGGRAPRKPGRRPLSVAEIKAAQLERDRNLDFQIYQKMKQSMRYLPKDKRGNPIPHVPAPGMVPWGAVKDQYRLMGIDPNDGEVVGGVAPITLTPDEESYLKARGKLP